MDAGRATRSGGGAVASRPNGDPKCALSACAPDRDQCNVDHSHGGGDINIVQIYAVPRGARVAKDGTVTTIDGMTAELSLVAPYEATPALLELTDQSGSPPAPLEVVEPGAPPWIRPNGESPRKSINSERFRSAPRTRQSLHDKLSVAPALPMPGHGDRHG